MVHCLSCIVIEIISRHLLDKHISIVNALHTSFGEFLGRHRGHAIFSNAPLVAAEGRRVRY